MVRSASTGRARSCSISNASTRSYDAATRRTRWFGHVGQLEVHPVGDAGVGGVLARGRDRRLVEVEAVDRAPAATPGRSRSPPIPHRSRARRPGAVAAGRRSARRRACWAATPTRAGEEGRLVEVPLDVVDRVVGVGHAAAGSEGPREAGITAPMELQKSNSGPMEARLSGRQQALLTGSGSANRRRSGSGSSVVTSSSPATACCSSHSRAYRPSMPAAAASSGGVHGSVVGQGVVQPELAAEGDRCRPRTRPGPDMKSRSAYAPTWLPRGPRALLLCWFR